MYIYIYIYIYILPVPLPIHNIAMANFIWCNGACTPKTPSFPYLCLYTIAMTKIVWCIERAHQRLRPSITFAYTRYCHAQYCMVYGACTPKTPSFPNLCLYTMLP